MPWTIGGPDRVSTSSGRRSRARALPPTRAHMGCRLCEVPTRSAVTTPARQTIASTGSTTSTECVCRGCQRGCQTALGEPFGDLQGPILSVDGGEPAGIRTQDTRIKSPPARRSSRRLAESWLHRTRERRSRCPRRRPASHRRGCQRGCQQRNSLAAPSPRQTTTTARASAPAPRPSRAADRTAKGSTDTDTALDHARRDVSSRSCVPDGRGKVVLSRPGSRAAGHPALPRADPRALRPAARPSLAPLSCDETTVPKSLTGQGVRIAGPRHRVPLLVSLPEDVAQEGGTW